MNRTKKKREPNVAAWKGHYDSCLIILIVSLGIYNYMNIEVRPSLPAYLSPPNIISSFLPFLLTLLHEVNIRRRGSDTAAALKSKTLITAL